EGLDVRRAERRDQARRSLLRADVHPSGAGLHGRRLSALPAGERLPERRAIAGVTSVSLLDRIPHRSTSPSHRPWPRAIVGEEGWLKAIDSLAAGEVILFGLWGEANAVHMALLGEPAEIAVLSLYCVNGKFPSVSAPHPPPLPLSPTL